MVSFLSKKIDEDQRKVLILIVVDDGLVLMAQITVGKNGDSLNPYCSGRWSRTALALRQVSMGAAGLNPYCSGRWSRTFV